MTGVGRAPAPLRPADPRTLGPYELLGRLGQGGMGTVYLARDPHGVQVAVKMIRVDLAPDDEFRRRFRSEVNRVRQVPPFCTAEVLDADPDHEHPYLVVEYVDGPTLAEVVSERGPLRSSNLHSVAIGVATALTAIHGAGVIHRDLKPGNVLLAPGTPKVIDFGIARALEATSQHTGTGQMLGTVAYMAPERFDSDSGAALTPAADIFAWGGVVAYAGTGRTPFGADSAPATAGRILTQPPDLTGLSGPLRSLIAHSLEKDPANRPTARELLDLLLSTGSRRSAATVAALAHQPGLQAAAREAQAATDLASARQLTTAAAPGSPTGAATTQLGAVGLERQVDTEQPTSMADMPTVSGLFRVPRPASPAPISPAAPAAPAPPGSAASRRRRWLVAVALLCALAGAAAVVAANPATPGVGVATPSGSPADGALLFTDQLSKQRLWKESSDAEEGAGCSFEGALVVRRQKTGSFRCNGPLDVQPADQRVEVGVRLLSKGSCASLWMRYRQNRGYQVRVCDSTVYVGTHRSSKTEVYKTFPLDDRPIGIGKPSTRITVSALGDTVRVSRDGALVGEVRLTAGDITGGRVVLGIFTEPAGPGHAPPYQVAFDNVSVWSLGS